MCGMTDFIFSCKPWVLFLLCVYVDKTKYLSILGLNSFDDVLKTTLKAKRELCEILSSCEMIDSLSLDLVTGHLKLKSPLENYPFYMVIETHGSNNEHDEEKLNKFLENVMSEGLVLDGTTTNEPGKMRVRTFLKCNLIVPSSMKDLIVPTFLHSNLI